MNYGVGVTLWNHKDGNDDPQEEEISTTRTYEEARDLYNRILKAFPELSNRTGGSPAAPEEGRNV